MGKIYRTAYDLTPGSLPRRVARNRRGLATLRLRHILRVYRVTRYAAALAALPLVLCASTVPLAGLLALAGVFLAAVLLHLYIGDIVRAARAERQKNLAARVPVSPAKSEYTYNSRRKGTIL